MIPVFRPSYDAREEEAVCAVLRSGWVGLGPKVADFEERFSAAVGARYGVGVNSCTSALLLALMARRIGPGDEVLVPTITFVSTASVVRQLGAEPIFCDVDEATLLLDWNDAARRITQRTKAVIPVLYAGQPVEPPRGWRIPLIYDCAHAAGSSFSAAGKTCCWSFHAVKNLATGDGGMVTTDDAELAQQLRRLRWLGIDRSTWDRTQVDRRYWWEYRIEELGTKCQMNDIAAAIGLVQLEKLRSMQLRRQELAARYRHELPAGVHAPAADADSSWHLFVIRTPDRDALSAFLAQREISTSVHYKPLHLYDCFGRQPVLPVAERVWRDLLTLPLFPDLSDDEQGTIIGCIHEYFGQQRDTHSRRVEDDYGRRSGVRAHAS